MQCDCDDTVDDHMKPSKICAKHAALLDRVIASEREECINLALVIETAGRKELVGDPDVPTPITDVLRMRSKLPVRTK